MCVCIVRGQLSDINVLDTDNSHPNKFDYAFGITDTNYILHLTYPHIQLGTHWSAGFRNGSTCSGTSRLVLLVL